MQYDHEQKSVKKPKDEVEMTDDEVEEFEKCALDFYYWVENYAYVQGPKGKTLFVPRDYQKRMIDSFIDERFTISTSPRQSGKKLSLDNQILTPNGVVRNGDLSIGDLVYGRDGKPTTITDISKQEKDVSQYKVIFDNGEEVLACGEHLWVISHAEWDKYKDPTKREKIVTTEEMIEYKEKFNQWKNAGNIFINATDPVEFEQQEVEIDPYTLGLWLGDGTRVNDEITCLSSDYETYDKALPYEKNFVHKKKLNENRQDIGTIRISDIKEHLDNLGMHLKKHIPKHYMFNSQEVRKELVRGLMDSDGHCVPGKGSCEFYQKDEQLIEDFRFILSSLGVKNRKRKKKINGQYYFTVTFTVHHEDWFCFKLPRKKNEQLNTKNHKKNKRHYIHDIIPLEEHEKVWMQCLMVDNEDHMFLCSESLIPTHNSQTVALFLLHTVMFFPDESAGVTSYKLKNVKDVMKRIKYTYEALPFWMKPAVKEYNQFSISFINNSQIVSEVTNENTFRGETHSIIFSDELSHVKPIVAEEFWTGILPSIEADGNESSTKMLIVSTPNGTAGKFAEIWFKALNSKENGFNPIDVKWWEIPGRDEEYKKKMLRKMNKNKYLQEYECVSGDTLINVLIDNKPKTITIKEAFFNEHVTAVLTPNGYKSFETVRRTSHNEYLIIEFEDGRTLTCSLNHALWCDSEEDYVKAKDIVQFDVVSGLKVFNVKRVNASIDLYDFFEVENHCYYTNGILSHNCQFLSDKGTLINSAVLEQLEPKEPITDELEDLDVFEQDIAGHNILIACDVSEGVGQDFHAAQIIDIDNFEQIGEYRNNVLTQTEYTKQIISMIKLCQDLGAKEVYYTVENNSIGMGILTLLSQTDSEVLDEATLVSHMDYKKPGMPMTSGTKPHGCALLRDFVEHGLLTVNSENLINELKFFVKSGNSFKAEAGMHDDLCMSMVVACLALEQLGDYEEDAYEKVNGVKYDEDNDSYEVGIFL